MTDSAAPVRRPLRPRRRIINAAFELAATGGYDAVQVRALSERAGVSSRTIYAHFASLDSLIILAVAEQSQPLYQQHVDKPPRGRTAAARVQRLISELNGTMTANKTLTSALLRALLSGKPDVVPWVDGFRDVLQSMLASAMSPKGSTAADRDLAEILEAIWFSAIVGWATGLDDVSHIDELLKRSSRAARNP